MVLLAGVCCGVAVAAAVGEDCAGCRPSWSFVAVVSRCGRNSLFFQTEHTHRPAMRGLLAAEVWAYSVVARAVNALLPA